MAKIGREDIRSQQLPFWMEFERMSDDETVVSARPDFILKISEIRLGDWRLRPDGIVLYVEYWNGTTWVVKHTFV